MEWKYWKSKAANEKVKTEAGILADQSLAFSFVIIVLKHQLRVLV